MKDEFQYNLPLNDDGQEAEYEKMLEKDIESQCDFSVYVNKLEINNDFSDEDLIKNKSKEEIVDYKNAQIIKLKAYIASLEKEKEDLIDNFKETTSQLLERLKDAEYKKVGVRPETPMLTKNMMKKGGVTKNDFHGKSDPFGNPYPVGTNKRQRCPNCAKDFPEEEFISHTLQCLRKTFHCKKCGELVKETEKKEHLEKFRAPSKILETINKNDFDAFKMGVAHGFTNMSKVLDKENNTALHLMAKLNRVEMMKFVLGNNDIKKDVNVINNNKETPLLLAIANKNEGLANLLIEHNANITLRDKGDMSPLMLCCKNGYKDLVVKLVERGANINEKNILGDTPLKIAQTNGHEDLAIMILKEYNVDIRSKK